MAFGDAFPRPLLLALLLFLLSAGCGQANLEAPSVDYRSVETASVDALTLPPEYRDALQSLTQASEFPPPDAAPLQWRPITLPRLVHRGESGAAPGQRLALHWYRVVHPVGPDVRRLAVYVPRFQPGIGRMEFYVDGVHVPVPATRAANHWNQPFLFEVPASALRGRDAVEVLAAVTYDARTTYALAPIRIGAPEALSWRAAIRSFLQSGAPEMISYAFLALGAFSFGVWWRRRAEHAYLYFALATLVWWVRTLHYHSSVVVIDSWAWWWLSVNSLSWLMVLVYQFALRFQGQRLPYVEWGLWALVVAAGLMTLPGLRLDPALAATVTYVAQVFVSVGVTLLLTREALRVRTREAIVLSAALWISIAFGVYDLLLKDALVDPRGVFLLPYAALFLFGSFLYAVLRRYTGAIEDVERVNASLEGRLAARTRELQASHERLRAVEREQTLAAERQRLMRDMHDGLGSSLMSSLVMVEQGRLEPADVARVLRECIDDLKLTIDSLEPIGEDLVTLLATLRYRLGRRLEAAGLRLDWQVQELPTLPWLDALSALEVLRMLQEALTNVVKHSGARAVVISTAAAGNEVYVRLADDGCGFDVARTRRESAGRGLPNFERRAAKLGGRVSIESSPAGTRFELALKVDRRTAGADAGSLAAERRAGTRDLG